MNALQAVWKVVWRSVLVALGYVIGLVLAGMIAGMLGVKLASGAGAGSSILVLFAASVLVGVFLGPFAAGLALTRRQHFALWGSLIIFNLGSVAIEGAYFAPALVPVPIPVLLAEQTLATAGAALAITLLFGLRGNSISWLAALRTRPWFSWVWRFLVSALSYLAFYFIFGGLNYSLVTKPFYETHAGGLTVPAAGVVFTIETIRGLLIVFSVLLFLLSTRGPRRQLVLKAGWLLFAIGGIIPLLWQINMLPPFLLAASAVEIFLQNFLTGAVAAWLLGIEAPRSDGSGEHHE